jgi:hypothetical protein
VAAGNLLVFAELAPVFAALASGQKPDPVPGLKRVIERYEAALVEPNPDNRSVMVLGANVMAVAHEQHRLQEYIVSAMEPPLADSLTQLVDGEVVRWAPGFVAHALAEGCIKELQAEVTTAWQQATTTFMMKLTTPDQTFVLHDPLPPPPPGPEMFLPPLAGEDAEAALHPWDLTGGHGSPCGVDDWTLVRQRMCYIVNLFRSRQRHPALTSPPFTPEQLAAMEQGKVPAGPL